MENIFYGFSLIFNFECMLVIAIGIIVGYFIGAMPGLTATIGLALMIPFTYTMNTLTAIVLLIAVFNAAFFGGAITSILVNTPGSPSSAATCLDGYPLARQGKAKKALGMSIWASGIGMFISTILMVSFAVPLAMFSLRFGPTEYFWLAILGLSVVAGLAMDSLFKGLAVASLGLFLTTIGMDPIVGSFRYVASFHFLEGIPFVPVMIGLFAISEVLNIMTNNTAHKPIEKIQGEGVTLKDMKKSTPTLIRSVIIGFIVGIVPAAGPNIASWISYNTAKRASKTPENFGKGELDGVAAPECANSSAVCGDLVTTLVLGIPGSATCAVLIGALMLHGINPGPLLFAKNPEIPYGIFATSLFCAPIIVVVGLLCARLFARVTLVPKSVLATLILATCTLGSYAVAGSMYGVWIAFAFGLIGYVFKLFGFPVAPVVLALVLGRLVEGNFRLSVLTGGGDMSIFFTRPISLIIIALTILMAVFPYIQGFFRKRKDAASGINK